MAGDQELEIYRQLRTAQEKYVYFLLAAAGAAIVLAVNQTQSLNIKLSQLPLGVGVLLWGLSFFFGCQHLVYVGSTLFANAELLKVESGRHRQIGNHPELMSAAGEGIRQAIQTNCNRASRYARLQFGAFVLGAIFYIAWHIYEMWLRTAAANG
jgi:hypothetical protein